MADGIIQLPYTNTTSGKIMDASELTVGANTVERERLVIADDTVAAALAPVTSSYGLYVDVKNPATIVSASSGVVQTLTTGAMVLSSAGIVQVIPVTSSGVNLYSTSGINVVSASSGIIQVLTSGTLIAALTSGTVTLSSNPTVVSASSGVVQVLTSGTLIAALTSGTVTLSSNPTIVSASSGVVQVLTSGTLIAALTSGTVTLSSNPTVVSASSGVVQVLTSGTLIAALTSGTVTLSSNPTVIAASSGTTSILLSTATVTPYTSSITPLLVTLSPITSGAMGSTSTPFTYVSSSSTNSNSVKAAAGTIYGFYAFNSTVAPKFLKIYNVSSAPTAGTTAAGTGWGPNNICLTFGIPASTGTGGAGAQHALPYPVYASNGIGFTIVANPNATDTGTIGNNDVVLTLYYV